MIPPAVPPWEKPAALLAGAAVWALLWLLGRSYRKGIPSWSWWAHGVGVLCCAKLARALLLALRLSHPLEALAVASALPLGAAAWALATRSKRGPLLCKLAAGAVVLGELAVNVATVRMGQAIAWPGVFAVLLEASVLGALGSYVARPNVALNAG